MTQTVTSYLFCSWSYFFESKVKKKSIEVWGGGGQWRTSRPPSTTNPAERPRAGPADAASAPWRREVPHWSNGGRDFCAVSLSWIIKVKISHLQKGETEGTGSCQLSARGGGGVSCSAGQTQGVRQWMLVVAGEGGWIRQGWDFANEH